MRVFNDLKNLPPFRNAVVTIGSFDGVHLGHQQILKKVNDLANSVDGESIVITFHPHPRLVVYPKDDSMRLITTIEEKVQLMERYNVDNLVVAPFTIEFSQQSADEYIQKFLVEKFHPKYIVIGYDHRFGLNRQGDI
ncbi:MAG: adenylyltransferase/cytidyltransferase family protein, partial [Phaeodactylibacter sp.]|nr:adenylyltransferase/cytidyltransferase family protein [Phaeodactylibacter sp.]